MLKKQYHKRVQRDVKKQLNNKGVGTKSQQALKLQQEQNKTIRKIKTKEQKEFEKEKMYSLRQQKKERNSKVDSSTFTLKLQFVGGNCIYDLFFMV